MADLYYSGQSCVDNSVIAVLSAATPYNIGDVVNVVNVNFPIFDCFTITSEANSGDTVNYGINNVEDSCIDCIQNVGGVFVFSECSERTSTVQSLSVNVNLDDGGASTYFGSYIFSNITRIDRLLCATFDGWDNR
jgi:hypothetical protein